ncbi:MAG: cytochrome P450 [Ilumatobacter sp.]|uniref:cytochrome P450 n=1 Tax=Ilumatobacter sp. TaxID=1967498 RepID=UPI00391B7758
MSTETSNTYHRAPSEVVTAPTGCPVEHTWSPLSSDYLADPYPIAARLRDEHPVFYSEQLGYVVVTRMDDVEQVFMNPDVFASTNVQDPIWPLAPAALEVLGASDFDPQAVMSNRPEPDHARIRVFTRQGFGNRRLKTLEDYMRRRATELLDEMIATGSPAEYVQSFAFPLPAEIVFRFLGFPAEHDAMIKSWGGNRKAFSWGQPSADEQAQIAEGMLDYWRYCRDFVAQRREQRADDFTSELLDAHEADPGPDRDPAATTGISYREVESVVYGISFAGHDPVTALLCNTLRCLLPRRDQWQALVEDPSLASNAVEETLRYESSQIAWRRVTTQPTNLGGVDLPVGTRVFLNFAAANHSPDQFSNPDTFDIHRSNANRHISFGKGIHFCLGAGLARMEARIALELLAERLPSLRLVPDQELTFFPNITFRGPNALHVEWD